MENAVLDNLLWKFNVSFRNCNVVCLKVGSQETPGVTGKSGLGVWNEVEQQLI